jgi:uncharacterized protein involved in tolerance to divalent cations
MRTCFPVFEYISSYRLQTQLNFQPEQPAIIKAQITRLEKQNRKVKGIDAYKTKYQSVFIPFTRSQAAVDLAISNHCMMMKD